MQSWEEALRELRGEFVTSSLERLDLMSALAARLLRDPADGEARAALRLHFHGLAGAGTSYGFARVTQLSLEGEGLLLPPEAGPLAPLSAPDLSVVRALIDSVRAALEAGPEGP